jgi:pheromone shutdown protein TraB
VIILIGVGHVFAIRDRLKEEIRRARPAIVCLELDAIRWQMLNEEKARRARGEKAARASLDWRTVGRGGLIFAAIARTQARLAKTFGSVVGDEMLAAKEAADELGAQTRLIDMDTREFTRHWMSKLSRRERTRLFLSAFAGIFASRKRVEKELKEYFDDEDAFVRELAAAFPQTKSALIDDRNAHMAKGIRVARQAAPVVVAVVGAGHLAGIREELLKGGAPPEDIRLVTLQELREPSREPPHRPATNAEFQVSFPPPPGPGGP